jgi:Mo-dependent nitrogenase C-terminus
MSYSTFTRREEESMNVSSYTIENLALTSWAWINPAKPPVDERNGSVPSLSSISHKRGLDILQPIRQWLDQLDVKERAFAHKVCQLIPAQCPFERDIKVFGRTVLHIPPLCKLNPVYEEVVGLRFRALCYLADECGEDVTQYC